MHGAQQPSDPAQPRPPNTATVPHAPPRQAKTPRRPSVITWRLVVVSLVVGAVLAVVSVPVSVAVMRIPWIDAQGSTSSRKLVFGERRIDVWGVHDPTFDAWNYRQSFGWTRQDRSTLLDPQDIVEVDRDPRPWRARPWLDGTSGGVIVGESGWPLRAAEWQHRVTHGHGGQSGPAVTAHTVGAWDVPVLSQSWPTPYLPLWPGLLGNTAFYAGLVLAAVALLRWRTLSRRARRGLCLACGYELGDGVGACPECGLVAGKS